MACLATLKRGHELDNYGQPFDLSPKRRRCSTNRTTFTPAKALQKDKKLDVQSLSESLSDASQFPRLPDLEPNQILNEVTAGYKQLKRRRLLPKSPTHQSPQLPGSSLKYSSPADARSSPSSSSDSDENNSTSLLKIKKTISESIQTEQRRCNSPESKKFTPDTQIRLTLRNVATICEALLRQREDTVREEYDKALQQKLSEQYEMFCRYSQDQLRQHKPSSSSSYIS
jgi:hypothetical protein